MDQMLLHPVKGGLIDTCLSIPTSMINSACLEFVAILLSIADDDDAMSRENQYLV